MSDLIGADNRGLAPVKKRELVFLSGNLTLAGTLLVPDRKEKCPGVVLVHGSGSSDRSNPWTKAYAEALSQRGIVVLHTDKRGCGKSEGDWRNARMDDLANDAVAALNHLRATRNVDPARVGLMGFSQGGQVVPLAATFSPAIRFAVCVSSSVIPMSEQMLDEVILSAERAGLTREETRKIGELHDLAFRFVDSRREEDWTTYAAALAKLNADHLKGNAVLDRFPKTRAVLESE